jgi:hypothetical protein
MGTSDFTARRWMLVLIWTARLSSLIWLGLLVWAMLFAADDGIIKDKLIPWDKASHFVSFYLLILLANVGFPRLPLWLTGLAAFAFGLAIEWIQPSFGRQFDWLDVLANALGIAAFAVPAIYGEWRGRITEEVFGIFKSHRLF